MSRLELLQAVIAEQQQRLRARYGWARFEERHNRPWWEEMEINARREMHREYKAFMRQHLAAIAANELAESASADEEQTTDEGQRNSSAT
ncbi:hypothetical protein AB4Z27_28565 [Cupriavidus sp. KB_39]|uniref:hypothetical protein n=1 Tax=Cupriavidus sp. KB_39 TaxID=3233036 RepID=UPI003F926AC3